jgi:hypothetical protein
MQVRLSEFLKASSSKRVPQSEFLKASSSKRVLQSEFLNASSSKQVPQSKFLKASFSKRVFQSDFLKASSLKRVLKAIFFSDVVIAFYEFNFLHLGTFNGWQKMRMSRSQKDFVAMVELGEGDHEYKFFVDGNWATDQNAPIIVNEAGFKNNKIHVQKEDFNAFDALDMDSATVAKAQSLRAKANASQPQSSFGQIMPHSVGIPMSGDHQQSRSGTGPPILPPHLLQVILNKVLEHVYLKVLISCNSKIKS